MANTDKDSASARPSRLKLYSAFLLLIAGLGGLLYGIDVGIIAAALLYLSKTISLSVEQTSIIVAAVLGGGTVSSLVAGILADLFGRKTLMIVSGLMFVSSVGIIVISQGFVPLFAGRLLQGMSGGVIAVVVPLYLAECLSANSRGRGTAIFQFMLTFGIVCAAVIGWFYTRHAEHAIALAAGNADLIRAAQNHAWRGMFLSVVYPGLIFFIGSFFLSESPRWLLLRGRTDAALAALRRSVPEEEAQRELTEMKALTDAEKRVKEGGGGTLLRRKYVIPFVLACAILTLNQTTGINSILPFSVLILRQAGMATGHATQGDVTIKVLNCVMTLIGVMLVDRRGRRFLLRIGTAGVTLALLISGIFLFTSVESNRTDVRGKIEAAESGNAISLPVNASTMGVDAVPGRTMALTVFYTYGNGDHLASVLSDEPNPVLNIKPEDTGSQAPLRIKRAYYGKVPSEGTGWIVTLCLCLFAASYASGPGVVVWLALSELMPTRIRSVGMGIALLLNQGASTLIAGAFLPVVSNYGYSTMFFFWAACTVLYFLTAAFFLPETKGKTLEEIEASFEPARS
jgi:MFS transporter, SP family, solute carrier family 2 (myo-inositol transporter), member 13